MTNPNFEIPNEDDLIESGLSQQPLIGSYSNFKLKLR